MRDFVVVKFGSELVTTNDGVDQSRIDEYATGLNEQYADDSLIVVTSGAVKTGKRRWENAGNSSELPLVTAAQLGSSAIIAAWEVAFSRADRIAGGLLVTHHELEDSKEGPMFTMALQSAATSRVVSVVNENDALSDKELMRLATGGDNDGLASHIARVVEAREFILFTEKGGVLDDSGTLIDKIDESSIGDVRAMVATRKAGKGGRGGMPTKLEAAWDAAQAGVGTRMAATNSDMSGRLVTEFIAN